MWEGTAVHNLVNQLPDSPYTKQVGRQRIRILALIWILSVLYVQEVVTLHKKYSNIFESEN